MVVFDYDEIILAEVVSSYGTSIFIEMNKMTV